MRSPHTAQIWDVVIIGAGPSGSILSLALARRGLSVLLLDQATFPRSKVCGGCLNAHAMSALAECGLDHLPQKLDAQPLTRMQLCYHSQRVELPFKNHWSISRNRLDAELISEAQLAGVAFLSGCRARMSHRSTTSRQVEIESNSTQSTVSAKIVILAHGLRGGIVAKNSRIGAGTILQKVPETLTKDGLMMVVGGGGYVGGVRVEDGLYDIAAALDVKFLKKHGTIPNAVNNIFAQAGIDNIPEVLQANWKGTPLLSRRSKQIAGERWFAVGDAAGYVEPFTGEGMAWAMNGALLLAPIVQHAVANSQANLIAEWEQTYRNNIFHRQLPCRVFAKILRSPILAATLVSILRVSPFIAHPVLNYMIRPSPRPSGVAFCAQM